MATRVAQKRLTQEYHAITNHPTEFVEAHPDESNILRWFYVVTGPPDTPYNGGQYMGTLEFPADYPFRPPAIRMQTPNGRFEVNMRLCLSISDYHPDTWNPAWSVSTILVGLLSFMTSEEISTGAIKTSDATRKKYAEASIQWNRNNPQFQEQFPHLIAQASAADSAEDSAPSKEHSSEDDSSFRTETRVAEAGPKDPNEFSPAMVASLVVIVGALLYAMIK